jgi:hypothetical protein
VLRHATGPKMNIRAPLPSHPPMGRFGEPGSLVRGQHRRLDPEWGHGGSEDPYDNT